MVPVTLRVLDGADRGRVFHDLETPVTIGREEGNDIQLNDERVSRFHVKIQSDGDRLVLTDLESTNGTKVNGEDMRLRVLRFGDLIQVGRTMLLVGSQEQIDARIRNLPPQESKGWLKSRKTHSADDPSSASDAAMPWNGIDDLQDFLFNHEPPEVPNDLNATQAAQLSELIDYLRINIRGLIESAKEEKGSRISLAIADWQRLLEIQARLAEIVRRIGEPDSSD